MSSVSPSEITTPLRIGTRGSPLALAQAHALRDRLAAAHPVLAEPGALEVAAIDTTGDKVLDRPLADIGGKGLFTQEIEAALRQGRVRMAVHSMKDVPTALPAGLVIACMLPRADPRDVLVTGSGGLDAGSGIAGLPTGAVVGTASLRRQAQLLAARPDLRVITFRGNVQTRLRKLAAGAADATLLALAGLQRLGLGLGPGQAGDGLGAPLAIDAMLPAVGQGAIGVEIRQDDAECRALLAPLDHVPTTLCVAAERALLAVLDGSCHTPIGVLAVLEGEDRIHIRALLAMPDGSVTHWAERRGAAAEALALARDAGAELCAAAGPELRAILAADR